jgi:hypothetical protein
LPNEGRAWAEQEPHHLCNAILRFPKGDPLCGRLATLARTRATPFTPWGTLGPDLLTEVLSSYDDATRFGSCENFYPLHWREAYFLWLPQFRSEVIRRTKGAAFLHCWAKSLSNMGIHPQRSAPTGSFLADILRDGPEVSPLTPWQRFQTQRRIGRFLRVHGINNHWSTRGGWDGLAHKLGFYVPTSREALAATRKIVVRHFVSRSRPRHDVKGSSRSTRW